MAHSLFVLALLLLAIGCHFGDANSCVQRRYDQSSFVCVCSSESCDSIDPLIVQKEGKFVLYSSDRDSQRFALENGNFHNESSKRHSHGDGITTITINRNQKQQEIIGFGGAFTDATGINVNSLNDDLQSKILESYFGKKGIEYNFGRVPIGGTDFSTRAYSYDDTEDSSKTLENFKLQEEDFKLKIPLIKQAKLLNPELELFASAWTAPKWMKTNNDYTGGGIKPEYYQKWADYYLKFFEEYEKQGIKFWGVTTGNEPSLALVPTKINTVGWLPADMSKWIANNLGPTLKNSKFNDLKVMMLDDQRLFLPWYPKLVIKNETDKFIDGIAVHWYSDPFIPSIVIDMTHDLFPNKFLMATEACRGSYFWEKAVLLGDWDRAADYAHSIIEDLSHHMVGWIDWNMVLNTIGGPTYINNTVDAFIIVNETAREFYKQPMFYAMGHFSKFITRGSHKLEHQASNQDIELAAFQRPDNGIVVVLHNRQNQSHTVMINDEKRGHVHLKLTAKSINTFIFW